MANSSNEYYQAKLYLCRYLLNTCKYQIVYNGLSNKSVVVQDSELHKSITDYSTLMAYGVIPWISCQQKIVALSSTEVEYMALSDCSCQLV